MSMSRHDDSIRRTKTYNVTVYLGKESYNNPTIMSFCVIQNVVFIARCSLGTWVPFTSCHGKDNIANMIDVGSVKHMHDTSLQITHCRFLIDE